jgi:hypothetical protein
MLSSQRLDEELDRTEPVRTTVSNKMKRGKRFDTRSMSEATSMENAVSSMFLLGETMRCLSQENSAAKSVDLATLIPEELGDIEYCALCVLLKVTIGKCVLMVVEGYTNVCRILLWASPLCSDLPDALVSQSRLHIPGLSSLNVPRHDVVVRTKSVLMCLSLYGLANPGQSYILFLNYGGQSRSHSHAGQVGHFP